MKSLNSRISTVAALFAIAVTACRRDTPPVVRAEAPEYLRQAFAALDTLLTTTQRDSLRHTTLDDAFRYRSRRLSDIVQPLEGTWERSAIGDSVIAHGESAFMTGAIVLDLYQQHLRNEKIDLAGALRRISPEYVAAQDRFTTRIDSVLVRDDVDSSRADDQFVREVRRPTPESGDSIDTPAFVERRFALFLDAQPSTTGTPAWSSSWDGENEVRLTRIIPISTGGSLFVITTSGGDADVNTIVFARAGTAREVLEHQIDYGEGHFAIHDTTGAVLIDVTDDVKVDGKTVKPSITCPASAWPGSTLMFDTKEMRFVQQKSICVSKD